jgi:hypothetical protein
MNCRKPQANKTNETKKETKNKTKKSEKENLKRETKNQTTRLWLTRVQNKQNKIQNVT